MGFSRRDQAGGETGSKKQPVRIFQFQRGSSNQGNSVSPFTEMPEELKRSRLTVGKVFRFLLNAIFMIILTVALVALVAAFAYEIVHHPDALAKWAYSITNPVVTFIQSIAASH